MTKRLEIRLLGPFEVLVEGAAADVGGAKRQALLAMLALREGRIVEVNALIDGLWGEELPSAPRNALHHHVGRLRSALGEDAIASSPDGYALALADVDALRFEELLAGTRAALRDADVLAAAETVAQALALWRGAALQGLPATAWFSAEAHRLETLRDDALEEEFEVRLALGEHGDLAAAIRAALDRNPFRERLWGQLMLALYRSGRQADALEAFQEARRVLGDELGLEPGPELRRLQDSILSHDPAIASPAVAPRRRGNLPAPMTSFVGREEELAHVAALLREHRLVTLIGPPGMGKSRVAVETSRGLEGEFPDGIWLVDLGRADGATDAVRLLARTLDVRGSDPLARAIARLKDLRVLVVLDACEHVSEAAGRIASELLAGCPQVRVLATSRVALGVPGEARIPLGPLGAAAVELFLERARAARPGLEADADAVALATEIARRVDGLPLAIELTAARANVLGLAEIVSTLEQRAALLRHGSDADPSRTALQELVDWSYDLLHGDEKILLQQLAVHRGGATLSSLAAVAAARGFNESTVTYLISALTDKSIVSATFVDGSARYDMLDAVREYVVELLAEGGELDAVRAAHAEYFAALAEQARDELRGSRWRSWETRLELENENLWAALAYARDAPDPAVASRLGMLGLYFVLGGRVSEGRRYLELALASSGDGAPVEQQADLLASLCFIATEERDLEAALAAGERAVSLAEHASARRELGFAQFTLALAAAQSGDEARGEALAHSAAAALEAVGDDWGVAAAGLLHATAAAEAGDMSTMAALAETVWRHADAIDYDAFRAPAFLLQAWVAERRGELPAAETAYRHSLELARRSGLDDHAAFALAGLGASALARRDLQAAEDLARQAIVEADAVEASWVAAHARVQLARVLAAGGDAGAAAALYREVVAWSELHRPRQAREGLFTALVGSPAAAARIGLDEISALT